MSKITINIEDFQMLKELTAQDFLLYHIIKNFSNERGCYIPMKKLSEISNVPYNNINRNLNRLESMGYIKIKKEISNLNKKLIFPIK